jgi:hypothetical protein
VVDPKSKQIIRWAKRLVETLDTYTEISPSGTGLHLFGLVKPSVPPYGLKKGSIELYTRSRYATITGNHLAGTPSKLKEVDVSWLYKLIQAKVFEFPAGSKYTKLYNNVGEEWAEFQYPSPSEADMALCSILVEKIGPHPEDIDRAFRLSGLMRKKWDRKIKSSTYGRETIRKLLKSSMPDGGLPAQLSEDALALRFSDEQADDLRFVEKWGRWRNWDGCRWEDTTLQVQNKVRLLCRKVLAECDPRRRKQFELRIASKHSVSAIEALSRCDPRHAASVDQWDRDPWLLNTPEGTVNLRTGKLFEHRRTDYCTKLTACGPGGGCPNWLAFLDRVTDHNLELQQFLQRIVGYALTGVTFEHALFFLYGDWRQLEFPLNDN